MRRVIQSAYENLGPGKINDLAKQSWSTLGYFLEAILRDSSNSFVEGFVGDACQPTAVSGEPEVSLAPGIALLKDDGISDDYKSPIRPILLRQAQRVEFTKESNPDGYDRIDGLFIRPTEIEVDERRVYHRDPEEGTKTLRDKYQAIEYRWDTKVVEGNPAANPSAPSAPAGEWLRIANVTRPDGQVNVQSGDISDERTAAPWLLGEIAIRSDLVLSSSTGENRVIFEDPNVSGDLRIIPDLAADFLDLEDDQGNKIGLSLGDLIVNGLLQVDRIQAEANSKVSFEDLVDVSDAGVGKVLFGSNTVAELLQITATNDSFIELVTTAANDLVELRTRNVDAENTLKEWARVDGAAGSIQQSYGLNNLTVNGTGSFTIELSQDVGSASEAIAYGTVESSGTSSGSECWAYMTDGKTVEIVCEDESNTRQDFTFGVSVVYPKQS